MRHLATPLHGLIGDVVLFFGKCCNSWQLATGLAICKVVNFGIIIKHFMKVMLCAHGMRFFCFFSAHYLYLLHDTELSFVFLWLRLTASVYHFPSRHRGSFRIMNYADEHQKYRHTIPHLTRWFILHEWNSTNDNTTKPEGLLQRQSRRSVNSCIPSWWVLKETGALDRDRRECYERKPYVCGRALQVDEMRLKCTWSCYGGWRGRGSRGESKLAGWEMTK